MIAPDERDAQLSLHARPRPRRVICISAAPPRGGGSRARPRPAAPLPEVPGERGRRAGEGGAGAERSEAGAAPAPGPAGERGSLGLRGGCRAGAGLAPAWRDRLQERVLAGGPARAAPAGLAAAGRGGTRSSWALRLPAGLLPESLRRGWQVLTGSPASERSASPRSRALRAAPLRRARLLAVTRTHWGCPQLEPLRPSAPRDTGRGSPLKLQALTLRGWVCSGSFVCLFNFFLLTEFAVLCALWSGERRVPHGSFTSWDFMEVVAVAACSVTSCFTPPRRGAGAEPEPPWGAGGPAPGRKLPRWLLREPSGAAPFPAAAPSCRAEHPCLQPGLGALHLLRLVQSRCD